MRRYLDGRTRLAVRDSVSHEVLHEEEVSIGTSGERIRLVNLDGIELGVDKSGGAGAHLRDPAPRGHRRPAATPRVRCSRSLQTAGARPFVAYGTLLGAVREGAVIGHDSDADLGYVSTPPRPVDVIRESFQLQREAGPLGLPTVRYSGAAFKVLVTRGRGVERGLDVFGGFFDDGRLYLMGEVGTDFEREWIYPLGTASLGGADAGARASPSSCSRRCTVRSWRVPDPAFQFSTPAAHQRALDDWFRGLRPTVRYWDRRSRRARSSRPSVVGWCSPSGPPLTRSRPPRRCSTSAPARGPDSLWLARQGIPVAAYDYVTLPLDDPMREVAERAAAARGAHPEPRRLALVLAEATRLAHTPRPRIVLATT